MDRREWLRAAAVGGGGLLLHGCAWNAKRPRGLTGRAMCNVLDHGARGDGTFDNRLAIQRAIDACAARGGGVVQVPAGRFRTGTIRLKSRVRLQMDPGSVIAGSPDPRDYEIRTPTPHVPGDGWGSALILAEGVEEISIGGQGTITGGGLALTPDGERGPFRPRLVAIEGCREVTVEGVNLLDADRWTLHLHHTDHVRVRGLRIRAGLQVLNTDGIDVDGCDNVLISDCDIAVGDDCVVLKTADYLAPARPCRNVTVTNCAFATRASGFKIGTETHHDFSNIVFSNSVIYAHQGTEPHTGIALESVDGAHVSGVAVSNVALRGVVSPIFLRLGNRGRRQPVPTPGSLSDVVIDNVVATDASLASSITGIPGYPVQRVTLSGLRVQARGGGAAELAARRVPEAIADYPKATMFGELPAYGLFVRHAEEVSLRDLRFATDRPDARPVLLADDVATLRVDGLSGASTVDAAGTVHLRAVRGATFRDAPPQRPAAPGP